jgi:transcriptional regulator with AAA-type ATPase domain
LSSHAYLFAVTKSVDGTDGAKPQVITFPSIVELVGASTISERARLSIGRAAEGDDPMLIVAEPGLDACAVARAIHESSARAHASFMIIDCASEDAAVLERQIFGAEAFGGTLLLTNLDALPAPVQARLARVLRDGQIETDAQGRGVTFDVRVIGSVSAGVDEPLNDGTLRRDLCARFNIRLDLPPLRQRPADIPLLIGCLVGESAIAARVPIPTFTREALTLLGALPWRRNFEELREVLNLLVRSAAGGVVRLEDVLDHVPLEPITTSQGSTRSLREARLCFERHYIASVLSRHRGRMEDAAKTLGMQRTNLYRKVRQLGIGARRAKLALLLLLMTPVAANAQIVAPRETAQIEFGPVSLYPSIQIREAGIDRNVFNEGSDTKEDFTFTLASRALGVVRLGANELLFSSGSDYVWLKDNASQRANNATYAFRFNLSASRWKPYVGGQRAQTRARPGVEIDTRARRIEQMAVVGSDFNLTERSAVTMSAQWDESDYGEGERFRGVDLDQALSSVRREYTGGYRYAITPFTTVWISGHFRDVVFPNSHVRDLKSYSLLPRVDFSPEAALRGSFTAGYEVFVPGDEALTELRGLVMSGDLNWAMGERTLFDLIVDRSVNYAYDDLQPYYLQTGARLTVTQRLFGPIGLQGSAERQNLAYRWRRELSTPVASTDRVDTFNVLSGGVTVNLGQGFSVLIGVEKSLRRSSDDSRQNFDRTRILSTLTLGR